MRRFIAVSTLCLFSLISFAKKDSQAWKTEKTMETQFGVFKENASYWDGYFMFKEIQLNEFHQANVDSVKKLEISLVKNAKEIVDLKSQIETLSKGLEETQKELDASNSREANLVTLGMEFDKTAFPPLMYAIILAVLAIAILAFVLFFRSNMLTKETEQRYVELTEQFELHKKRSLEREMKLNRELQTERNKNYN